MYFITPVPVIFIIIFHIHISLTQEVYDGHYDLKARDAAYLCVLMNEYLETGKQPSLTKVTHKGLSTDVFLKNGRPCWKFAWIPCDAALYQHTAQKPCGWYEMQNAPDAECT